MENKSILRVLRGYLNLSAEEKETFYKEITKQRTQFGYEQLILERIEKSFSHNLGPTNDTACECCGRG